MFVGPRAATWLPLVCFTSGAAGLIFEIVWFHRSSLVFGSSVLATSLVLSSFMGGLTIGGAIVGSYGRRIRRVLQTYAVAESLVAIAGVTLTYALPGLTRAVVALTNPAAGSTWLISVVRFLTAFAILLVPATAMGATLPLLVAALSPGRRFGSALGQAYGWNTLGAVAGVVGAEVWLIGLVGVAGSAWVAGGLSLAAAIAARSLAPPEGAREPPEPPASANAMKKKAGRAASGSRRAAQPAPVRRWPLLAGSFFSGAALLALEVVWFRFLTMYVLSTTLAASLMLAVVLAAIALGGLAASAWLQRNPQAIVHLPLLALAAGCSVTGSYAAFQRLTTGVQIASSYQTVWLACALTLPTSLLSGMFFTLLGDALQRAVGDEMRTAGWLSLANTAGGMCGPLVAAFVLLPLFGMEGAFFSLTAVYAGIGVLALVGTEQSRARLRSPVLVIGGVGIAIALAWFPFGSMRKIYLPRVVQPYAADGSEIVATREGPSETIVLMQQKWLEEPVYSRLVTNGFSMSGTAIPAARYMRYFAYLPMLLHEGPLRRALVVCYGVGVTAGAALDVPSLETLDVAEISRDVVAMSDIIYPSNPPLHDPRVRLHLEDGRQFLQTTSERFDLITGEPPPPRTPGTVNIYTREYFQLTRDRLADGGLATYWLPVGRPNPGTNVSSIVRAFCDVFDDCSLWNATPFDLMLLGTRGGAAPVAEAQFTIPWTIPSLRTRFSEIGFELPQQIGATFLGDAAYLRELTASASPLVDNYPQRLNPAPGRPSLSDPGYGVDPAVTKLYQAVIDPTRARRAFATSPLIRRLWPGRILDATDSFFEHQAIVNRVLWDGGRPLQQIENLHWLLTKTPLRTLPLWILGTDSVKDGIARRHADGTGALEYARGLASLAERDYLGAAAALANAEQRGLQGEAIRPLRVYALSMANDIEDAKRLASGVQPRGADERHFWEWLGPIFGVGPSGGGR